MNIFEMIKALFAVLLLLGPVSAMSNEGKPVLLASIKPLAMIAKAVVGDVYEVKVLLPASVSPHTYSLKFSDIRQMKDADMIVWVGPSLETPLAKLLKAESANTNELVTAETIKGLSWPRNFEDHVEGHESPENHHQNGDHPNHGHSENDHSDSDPHVWLNTENALLIARTIKEKLSVHGPATTEQLESNFNQFEVNIEEFEQRISELLPRMRGKGFVVLHDGYRHLVDRYGLLQLSSVRLPSGGQKGLKHRAELFAIKDRVDCVFSEPQWPTEWATQIAKPLSARIGVLDPMGTRFDVSNTAYLDLMTSLFSELSRCLYGQSLLQE